MITVFAANKKPVGRPRTAQTPENEGTLSDYGKVYFVKKIRKKRKRTNLDSRIGLSTVSQPTRLWVLFQPWILKTTSIFESCRN